MTWQLRDLLKEPTRGGKGSLQWRGGSQGNGPCKGPVAGDFLVETGSEGKFMWLGCKYEKTSSTR